MENLKSLTSQQLAIATAGASVVASIMLWHGSYLGFFALALALVCGIGALVKYKSR